MFVAPTCLIQSERLLIFSLSLLAGITRIAEVQNIMKLVWHARFYLIMIDFMELHHLVYNVNANLSLYKPFTTFVHIK